MPKQQTGAIVKRSQRNYGARFYDEAGVRQYQGGFSTATAASTWLRVKVDEISALRRGEAIPASERSQTVDGLLDVFLDKHGRTIDPATVRKLTAQLKHARAEFGERHPDSLRRIELEDWREQLPSGSRRGRFPGVPAGALLGLGAWSRHP